MSKFTVRTSVGAEEPLGPITEALTKLLTNVYECADDGGTEGAEITRITVRRNDSTGWLLVCGWTVKPDASIRHQDGSKDSAAYVSFHGGSELLGALAKLEEALADGEVVLIPDRFNGNKPAPRRRK